MFIAKFTKLDIGFLHILKFQPIYFYVPFEIFDAVIELYVMILAHDVPHVVLLSIPSSVQIEMIVDDAIIVFP